jgi:hypothetical protein
VGAAPNGRVSAKPCCTSFGGREGQQWASVAWFRGGGFAVGQANTASSTPHARDKSRTQTKTQPKTPSKPSKKEKDTLRHTLRHTLQGPRRDCTVPREATTGPLRPSSAARALSFSLPSLLTATDYSLAPSLTRFQPSAVPRPASHSLAKADSASRGCLCHLWS